MKASSGTSAKATARPHPTDRSSDKRRRTHTSAEGFTLTGPSRLLDPQTHAYRKDLADVALIGQVIASHYAEPVARTVASDVELRITPNDQAEIAADLSAGAPFLMLDDSLGWAWGYAGTGRRVGYVPISALTH